MTIIEVLEQVRELLRSKGRVSYRLLKTQFHLSSDDLAALTDELIAAERVAIDEDGKVLVWVGNNSLVSSVQGLESQAENSPEARRQPLVVCSSSFDERYCC